MGKASSSTTEGGEILRRKEEMLEAFELAEDTELLGMRRLTTVAQARSGKTTTARRKTKVIKKLVPEERIKFMIATPHPIIGRLLTDDQLAERPKSFREAYARGKAKSGKVRAYYQAIIDQYNTQGCAYDEFDVTDDEEETVEN